LIHIGREGADSDEQWSMYSGLLKRCGFPAPMVIYVEPGLVDIVKKIRRNLLTKIVPQGLAQAHLDGVILKFMKS
jgi:hypothetical protein